MTDQQMTIKNRYRKRIPKYLELYDSNGNRISQIQLPNEKPLEEDPEILIKIELEKKT